ncbi:MAG: hypothetical protein WCO52_05395 [bacterium]
MKTAGRIRPEFLVVAAILIGGGLLSVLLVSQSQAPASEPGKTSPTTQPSASSIPTSVPGAKQYISDASAQAAKGDYTAAEATLKEAIKLYPDDKNLTLTLEYYENEAVRHNQ